MTPDILTFESVDDILEFAIKREAEAYSFYIQLMRQTDSVSMKAVFEDFADEEMGHKKKLQRIQEGQELAPSAEKVLNLKMADYLIEVAPSPTMNMQDALIVAMKREKTAFRLYNDIADSVGDEKLKALFLSLAQEEAKHKLKFETLYDEQFLAEG